jgi:hypothetical protein
VEGTPGSVDPNLFRERAGETALGGPSRILAADPASSFARDRYRTVAVHHRLPGAARHELATGSVRTEQVGVNPSHERSLRWGVWTPLAEGTPWPGKARLAITRKGGCHLHARRFGVGTRQGLDGTWVCSWVSQLQKSVGGTWRSGLANSQLLAGLAHKACVKACRTLDSGGKAGRSVAAFWSVPRVNAGQGLRDLPREDVLGLGNACC